MNFSSVDPALVSLNTSAGKALGLPVLSLNSCRPIWLKNRRLPCLQATCKPTSNLKGLSAAYPIEEGCEQGDVSEFYCHSVCSAGESVDYFEHSASMSRSFVLLRPTTTLLRRVLPRKSFSTRPAPFFVVLLTSLLYLWLSVRTALSNKVKSCTECAGFGIRKCDLCEGHRVIWWEGKYKHMEPCPKCFGKRYVRCSKCGGVFGRSLFAHKCCTKISMKELKQLEKDCKVDEKWVGAPKWVT